MQLLTPKFLTAKIAKLAVEQALKMVMEGHTGDMIKRKACHIVVMVSAMEGEPETGFPVWPNNKYSVPYLLYEHSYGDGNEWTGKYDKIARGKALQLWHERNDDRTDIMPHLLFPGDAIYYGGVKRHGIVVACSGVQEWFDKMIAGIIADLLIGLAYNEWMTSPDKEVGVTFLT